MAASGNELPEVIIYTDGACLGNPGKGGYGVVLISGNKRKEISGGFSFTTNNRMELYAAIVALESLKKKCAVKLYTDSNYVVQAIREGWAKLWKLNGWRTKKKPTINRDLWQRLLDVTEKHQVEFFWVKGHAGITENERCDELANAAALEPDLPEDKIYLAQRANSLF
jgi:ribonuclease HI